MINFFIKKRHCMNLANMKKSWSGSLSLRKIADSKTRNTTRLRSKIYRSKLGNTRKKQWICRTSYTNWNYSSSSKRRNRRLQNLLYLLNLKAKAPNPWITQTSHTITILVLITQMLFAKISWMHLAKPKKNQFNASKTSKLSSKTCVERLRKKKTHDDTTKTLLGKRMKRSNL